MYRAHSDANVRAYRELPQPILTIVRLFLAKCEIDQLALPILRRAERDHVFCHVGEVVASIRVLARSETLNNNNNSQFRTGRRDGIARPCSTSSPTCARLASVPATAHTRE